MSTNRFKSYRVEDKKGSNKRLVCRQCQGLCTTRLRKYCSYKCRDSWFIARSSSYARWKVEERDKGVCALCKTDCVLLEKQLKRLYRKDVVRYTAIRNDLIRRGWSFSRVSKHSLWDADHIVPVAEGGGECGLDNYRTLCSPCHKKVTADLRKRLAEANRNLKE